MVGDDVGIRLTVGGDDMVGDSVESEHSPHSEHTSIAV